MKIYTSNLSGVSFEVKGKRICFTIMDSKGKNQNYWLNMTDKLADALNNSIKSTLEENARIENMSPDAKREYYSEFIC
jgi:hypothetical protein